jgi:hypothetical protein
VTTDFGVCSRGRREAYARSARNTRPLRAPQAAARRPSRHGAHRLLGTPPALLCDWLPASGPFRVEPPV